MLSVGSSQESGAGGLGAKELAAGGAIVLGKAANDAFFPKVIEGGAAAPKTTSLSIGKIVSKIFGTIMLAAHSGDAAGVDELAYEGMNYLMSDALQRQEQKGDDDGFILSFKAPTKEQLAAFRQAKEFSPKDYPGLGAFFTIDPLVAGSYANARGAGVFTVATPISTFIRLIRSGGIVPDPDPKLSGNSFIVRPRSLSEFSKSSVITHIPSGSFELYDKFNAQ